MKIAYFIPRQDFSLETGVNKKIATQIRHWQALGHEVRLYALSPSKALFPGLEGIATEVIQSHNAFFNFLLTRQLIRRILQWAPDVVYMRFKHYYPGQLELLSVIPTIAEMNSDDLNEMKLMLRNGGAKAWVTYLYHRLTRALILNKVRGFVCVTHEIAGLCSEFPGRKTVIANGLNLDEFDVMPVSQSQQAHLVFMAFEWADWFGIDKIFELARAYPGWQFDFIGLTSENHKDIPHNVTCYGKMHREQYLPILEQADVAIGTLAYHRKHMDEANPLKVMEYLSSGLPVIIAFTHTDFPEPVPFLLQLPNTEDNVRNNLKEIEDFVSRWKGKRVIHAQIRQLDSREKEKARLAFLEDIVAQTSQMIIPK